MAQIKRLSDGTLITTAEQPFWTHGVWFCGDQNFTDPQQNQYVAVPAPAVVQMQFTPPEFESKMFELAELTAIRASTDAGVIQALRLMDDPRLTMVDLTATSTIKFINYLSSLSLLTAARTAQILAGTPAP